MVVQPSAKLTRAGQEVLCCGTAAASEKMA